MILLVPNVPTVVKRIEVSPPKVIGVVTVPSSVVTRSVIFVHTEFTRTLDFKGNSYSCYGCLILQGD